MTLQEAKDQVAQKKFGLKWNVVTVRQVKGMELLMGEVAELYARSKWDESCNHYEENFDGNLPSKPEFKP